MNRIVRMLAITGLGVTAGATIGAGAAQAATTTNQDSTHRVVAQSRTHFDDTEIVGYFNSPLRCERAGRIGELRDQWEDYDCNRVRYGFRRGAWALQVTYDNGNGWWHGGFGRGCPSR